LHLFLIVLLALLLATLIPQINPNLHLILKILLKLIDLIALHISIPFTLFLDLLQPLFAVADLIVDGGIDLGVYYVAFQFVHCAGIREGGGFGQGLGG
jgi:hypothetical protein